MSDSFTVLHEDEHQRIQSLITKLHGDASAKIVSLIDKNGQQIAVQGDTKNLDVLSLACLTAGNVAATDGLARLLGEREFSVLFHEGEHDNIHISVVARRAILIIVFDDRSSLGLVRLRVKKASVELENVLVGAVAKTEVAAGKIDSALGSSPFAEITDDDIESLFRNL
ncbi:MAG: roadblock/LC7 domain-containing protein [Acidobacteria bacterium]|nr:roadblock/LC7 domain-containing protein [Acidobacteriota bacterium]MBI3656458.1 roadblock/LC7 domain-containing protein [Acidobacteriota bacterium]